jgi:putative redox protein
MVVTRVEYEGNLHCKLTHAESGATFATDAPKDNQGLGESFSPTDLVAAALGSCILSVMGILARSLDIDIVGTTAEVEKEMAASPVRMIKSLSVKVRVPIGLSEKHQAMLARAAHSCPVHKSLHPDIDAPIEFSWG